MWTVKYWNVKYQNAIKPMSLMHTLNDQTTIKFKTMITKWMYTEKFKKETWEKYSAYVFQFKYLQK